MTHRRRGEPLGEAATTTDTNTTTRPATGGGIERRMVRYLPLLILLPALGLGSRRYGAQIPPFIAAYAGDTLWSTMIYATLAVLFRRWSPLRLAVLTFAISVADELLQLYHAPWIEWIRATTPGALLLGHTFLWSDIVCYLAGTLLAVAIDLLLLRRDPA